MNKLRNALVTSVFAAAMVLPGIASAQGNGGAAAVGTAVSDAAGEATSIVMAGIPIILGVAALWVALKFGGKLLKKLG